MKEYGYAKSGMKSLGISFFAAAILFMGTASCSSKTPIVEEFNETASPTEQVTALENDLKSAKDEQIDIMAPRSFEEAEDHLKLAKKSLSKEKPAKDTLHLAAVGRAYLNQSNVKAKVAGDNMEEVFNARKDALKADAPTLFPKELRNADEDLKEVTEKVENGKMDVVAKNRTKLQDSYLDLELKSIKEANLRAARDNIKMAIKEGAKEYAPRTLAIAEKNVADTDAFITANRHDYEQVAARKNEAQASSEHLLKITRDSKSGKTSSEEMALLLESKENKLSSTENKLSKEQSELASRQYQLAREKDKSKELLAETEFNNRFEKAQQEFSSEEAEVYRQGDTLVIRLRGLEFPSGKAAIRENNHALLDKVKKVMEEFNASSVVVEGHTDSSGGKKVNKKLSEERAESVKDYFVSNAGSRPLEIQAVGYGDQKPLATNKTPDGRAQNRRVDILIKAEESKKE